MEPEYIERKALDKALTAATAHDKDKNRRTWAKAICILHDLPAADVVAVVRCEQCAHGYDDISGRCCIYADGPVKDDFFCRYGERNEVILGGLEAGGG
ncbi:MAG: hypothetical protein ACLVAC_01755 [Oscillospiraceae bacterium]